MDILLPSLADLAIPASIITLLVLVLLLAVWSRRQKAQPDHQNWVLIDGSNVMHWHLGEPKMETVRDVVRQMERLGHAVAVIFDANAGYLLAGRYLNDHAFARLLGLPGTQVMVVPKGSQADPWLLETATHHKARIVTNDRYRDWVEAYPLLQNPGPLIRGGYRSGALWLDLPKI